VLSALMFLALIVVIALSLAAGVGLGYAIIFGILYLFDRSRPAAERSPAPALHGSASGD
jgi:hypothetical protein